MADPPILLRGTFAQTPLPELLVHLLDRGLAGTLVLQAPDGGKSAVLIVRGAPGKARLANHSVYLGDVLVDMGLLGAEERGRFQQEASRSGRRLGQVLIAHGRIDEATLFDALREQLHRQVLALCDLPPSTAFGLYRANYLHGWGGAPEWRVKPMPLIWRALVDKTALDRVRACVAALGARKLRMRFEAPVGRYRMERVELAAVNVLRAQPQSAGELLEGGVGPAERVERVIYGLVRTRQLDGGTNEAPPVGFDEPVESSDSLHPPSRSSAPPRSAQVPPSSRPSLPSVSQAERASVSRPRSSTPPRPRPAVSRIDELEAFREEILERQRQMEQANFYEILGLDSTTDLVGIRSAFFQLAKRWHPDRLPKELEDLRETVTRIFTRMTEAHRVLSDHEQRALYDEGLKSGKGTDEQEQVLAVLRAATAFQRAEVLMKKRDEAGALREARAAYEGDPSQAEYAALYAWLESRHRKDQFDDLVALLDRAVTAEPDNVRVRWYRGQLLKKVGREAQAIRDFRHVVSLAPGHLEAHREIRVYEMRRKAAGGSSASSSGLFSRWRKK